MLGGVTGGPARAAGPCPDDDACLVVHLQGSGPTRVVTGTEIDAWHDLDDPNYQVRTTAGGSTSSVATGHALSLRELVTRLAAEPGGPFAGVAVDAVRLVTVPNPANPYVATLTPPALGPSGSNGFAGGLMPAVFVNGRGDSVGYIRPLTGDDDVNGRDYITTSAGGPLDLTLSTTGTVLHPKVTASPSTVVAGDPVQFSVDVPDAPPGGVTYAWEFDGGDRSADAAPSHTWAQSGTYDATVTVTGDDGSIGQSSVTVSVGTRPSPSSAPTASSGPGGGTNPDQGAPSKGPDKGSKGTKAGATTAPTPGSGSSGSGSSGTGSGTGDTGNTGTVAGGTIGSPTLAPPPGVVDAPLPAPLPPEADTPTPTPAPATAGDEVSGLLLASASLPLPAGTVADGLDDPVTAPTARESAGADPDSTVDPVVWWALVVPALLLAGAGSELRPLRRRLRPRA